MRKWKTSLAALLLSAVVSVSLSVSAFAGDSSVTYEGGAEKFVTAPADGNLFQNFQGVMPGDVLTQTIKVHNNVYSSGGVRLSLRAEGVDEAVAGFLNQMKLEVKNGDTVISQASPADQKGGLAENVVLGTFDNGEETNLTVTLTVPLEMGNDFQEAIGNITWVFTAEELTSSGGGGSSSGGGGGGSTGRGSVDTGTEIGPGQTPLAETPIGDLIENIFPEGVPLANLPKLGDLAPREVWIGLAVVSAVLLIVAVKGKKRKEEK